MELRSSNKENIEKLENNVYEYLPNGTRLSSWQYLDHGLTIKMKKYILETISNRLDSVRLDGSQENIHIKISLNPDEKIITTVSIREGQGNNKRSRTCVHPPLYTPLGLETVAELIHN